jgi:hypothetical protein
MPNKGMRRPANKIASQLSPYPRTVTPSADPPTVTISKKVRVALALETVCTGGKWSLSAASIATYLANQWGGAAADYYYVVEYIHAWGPAGNERLNMLDAAYGVEAHDSGSFATRPRTGLLYPKNIQTVRRGSATENLVEGAAGNTDPIVMRVGIVYWTSTANVN